MEQIGGVARESMTMRAIGMLVGRRWWGRRAGRLALLGLIGVVVLAGGGPGAVGVGVRGALAHDDGPQVVRRELVRLQGTRHDAPGTPGVASGSTIDVSALGRRSTLQVTDRRVFAVAGGSAPGAGAPSPADPAATLRAVTLQGERTDLARFNAARPDQRVTILAERRVGSRELFLLALDLCPAH